MTTLAEQLRQGKPVVTFTKGVSMRPLLWEGKTHVIVEPLRRPLRKGDLPMFQRPDGVYVIHRIIRVDGDHYETRGDNCLGKERVPKDWMVGLVTQIYRKEQCISVEHPLYRLYSAIWMAIYPARWVYYQLRTIGK